MNSKGECNNLFDFLDFYTKNNENIENDNKRLSDKIQLRPHFRLVSIFLSCLKDARYLSSINSSAFQLLQMNIYRNNHNVGGKEQERTIFANYRHEIFFSSRVFQKNFLWV